MVGFSSSERTSMKDSNAHSYEEDYVGWPPNISGLLSFNEPGIGSFNC